jgi:hypothetical protein
MRHVTHLLAVDLPGLAFEEATPRADLASPSQHCFDDVTLERASKWHGLNFLVVARSRPK